MESPDLLVIAVFFAAEIGILIGWMEAEREAAKKSSVMILGPFRMTLPVGKDDGDELQ